MTTFQQRPGRQDESSPSRHSVSDHLVAKKNEMSDSNGDPEVWTLGILDLPWDESNLDSPWDESNGDDIADVDRLYSMQSLANLWKSGHFKDVNACPESNAEAQCMTTTEVPLAERSSKPPQARAAGQEQQQNEEREVSPDPPGRSRRRYLTLGLLLTLLVVSTVSVVVVLTTGNVTNDNSSPASSTQDDSDGGAIGGQTPPPSRLQAFELLLEGVSSEVAWADSFSPQSLALQWLVWSDPLRLEPTTTSPQLVRERYILSVLFHSTGGSQWTDSFGFLGPSHICGWKDPDFGMGVTCFVNSQMVQAIQIGPNNLQGTIPPEIFLLPDLTSFQVVMNPGLAGPIPSTVGEASQLKVLNLNKNSLTGQVPASLLQLPNLTTLWMDDNLFEGQVPPVSDDSDLLWWSCNACGLDGTIPNDLLFPQS